MRYLFLLALASFPCFSAPTLTIYNWEYYLSNQVIEQWQQQTGVKVEQVFFDSDSNRDNTLAELTHSSIDLVIVDGSASLQFGNNGQLTNLTTKSEALPNRAHIPERWLQQCGDYSIPYFWGTMGLVYRSDKMAPPRSWRDILTPDEALQEHIGMLNDYWDLLLPPILLNHGSLRELNHEILEAAYLSLRKQVPYVLTYQYPISFIAHSDQADQLYLSMGYSGDEVTLNELSAHNSWKFVVPEEGTLLWMDCIAINAHSTQQQLAMQFINFINDPTIAAVNASEVGNASPNHSAIKLMKKTGRYEQALYPSETAMKRSDFYTAFNFEATILRSRIVNAILKEHQQYHKSNH